MSEFKLQQLVADLIKLMGGSTSNNGPEKLLDTLQRSIESNADKGLNGSQVFMQSHVQSIAEHSDKPELFIAKFEDLKQKNVDSLGPYTELLYMISQDVKLKTFLQKTNKLDPSISSASCQNKYKVTKDDLPQVRNRLKKAVTKKLDPSIQNSSVLSQLNTSTLPVASTPSVTSWVQQRPNMSRDFSNHNITNSILSTVPSVSQESVLIDDLLNILMGLPGCYIEPEELIDPYGPRTFKINDNVSYSLKELVKQILPLASHFSVITRFTEAKVRFEFGQVNNALGEAMEHIIKDHICFVVQLETEFRSGNLTLQKMWFFIQRNFQILEKTAYIASTISKSDAQGGKVLSLLHDTIAECIGNDEMQALCLKLMEAACVPYMKMLGMWIYRGIISDPIKEFLIEDMEIVQRDDMPVDYSSDYWDKKYSVRRDRVPKFLESACDIILKAGKYLNVIRQCGKSVKTKVLPLQYKMEEKHYMEKIENAYTFASQTLLDLVLKEKDLIGRLRSVKHYFLMEKGDFIVTFLTLTEKELSKNVADVNQGRLEALMELALRLSSAVDDPYKDELRTEFLQYDLQFQMSKIQSIQTHNEQEYIKLPDRQKLSVIELFAFTYEVHWPLSLILSKKSLARYQMIFRHLFYCKYVERMICQVWRANKVAKKFAAEDAEHYRTAFALRQKMLHCVQNLEYHMMVEVIEPHWCTFLQKILKVNNVDEILSCHLYFLDCCLKDCMLTLPHILTIIMKLLAISVDFCRFMQSEQAFNDEPPKEETQKPPSFREKISAYDVKFSATIMDLLDQITELNKDTREHDILFNLLHRMDFNGFYSKQWGKYGFNNSSKKDSFRSVR